MSDKPTELDYVAICSHGKLRGWHAAPDCTAERKAVAKWVAEWVMSGLDVKRMTTAESKLLDYKCPECNAIRAAKDAADEDKAKKKKDRAAKKSAKGKGES